MHSLKTFRNVGGVIGIAVSVLSVQAISSTAAHARSNHRDYGYRTHYRERNVPEVYQTGSSHWWEEMDRQGRGGRK
jgi:hypothetical protein